LSAVGKLHHRLVFRRRVDVLSSWFAQLVPKNARILDVGAGSGLLARVISSKRPDVSIRGIDVLPREQSHIPVEIFDGCKIPFENGAFDVVLFVDVLHHTEDPTILLREAARVAASDVLIKDHFRKGFAAQQRLRLMDWVGNARFGVSLPYNYWTEEQWQSAWQEIGLRPAQLVTDLKLYPALADSIFGAQLHFIGELRKVAA
jgi:SAM-dependent methyltransferase